MTIRKATINDAAPIATCLLLAMEGIVYRFIGENDPQKAGAFMLHLVKEEGNQYSWQNCWVAEIAGEVVAAVNVYDGARLNALRQPVLAYLASCHNRIILPEDETGPGEFYIDTLGVLPGQQGKGVGTALLQFLVREFVHTRHQALGLLVEEDNPAARRLYLRLGFQVVGKKGLMGKHLEHLQMKPQETQ